MTTRLLFVALLAFALLAPSARAAEEAGSVRDHFKKGQTHYALGEFNEAVSEFREAYRIKNEPAILFNIAQAMRQVGQYKQAHFYYSQYLHQRPDAPNRLEVESFMVAMKKKVDADEEAEKAQSEANTARPGPSRYPEDHLVEGQDDRQGRAPSSAAVSLSPGSPAAKAAVTVALAKSSTKPTLHSAVPANSAVPASSAVPANSAAPAAPAAALAAAHPGRAVHIAGYSSMGAGVVAGGLAFLFHTSAQSSADEFNRKYASGTLTAADAHLKSEVSSKGKLATVAAVGAGVLIATGAVLSFAF